MVYALHWSTGCTLVSSYKESLQAIQACMAGCYSMKVFEGATSELSVHQGRSGHPTRMCLSYRLGQLRFLNFLAIEIPIQLSPLLLYRLVSAVSALPLHSCQMPASPRSSIVLLRCLRRSLGGTTSNVRARGLTCSFNNAGSEPQIFRGKAIVLWHNAVFAAPPCSSLPPDRWPIDVRSHISFR